MSKWITGLLWAITLAGVCHADTAPQYFKAYQATIHMGDSNNPADATADGCHAVAGIKKWPHARTYRQVITTFVKL